MIPFICLCSLVLVGCDMPSHSHNPLPIPGSSQPKVQQQPLRNIESLNKASADEDWEIFFQERGALKLWKKLQAVDDVVFICLVDLEESLLLITDQADQVATGIIQYLCYHKPSVRKLTLIGSLPNPKKQLSKIPSTIGQLTNLNWLNLYGNRLQVLPTNLGDLVNLIGLDLEHNALRTLPPSTSNLIKLTYLNLSYNQFSNFPSVISNFVNLTKLYLSHNQLGEISADIGNLVNLKELYIDNNELINLVPGIGKLVNLEWLVLEKNRLSQLPSEIAQLNKLNCLGLGYNQFSVFPPAINNLPYLQWLFLNNNKLSELSPHIDNIENIYVDNNNLSALPASLDSCNGNFVELTNNPWIACHESMVSINKDDLTKYVYQKIRLSLQLDCAKSIQKFINQATEDAREELQEGIRKLPGGLQFEELSKQIKQGYQLTDDKRIIYFKEFQNHLIPFYWDQEVGTGQNIRDMLDKLKDKPIYLIPKGSMQK